MTPEPPVLPARQRRLLRQAEARGALVAELQELRVAIRRRGLRAVVAVPGDDVHVAAVRLAERVLVAMGYEVVNLGVMVQVPEIVDACRRFRPSAVILSSSNGHALTNCGTVPRRLAEAGLDIPVYLGGRLVVGRQDWPDTLRRFQDLGFSGVFAPGTALPEGMRDISRELLSLPSAQVKA